MKMFAPVAAAVAISTLSLGAAQAAVYEYDGTFSVTKESTAAGGLNIETQNVSGNAVNLDFSDLDKIETRNLFNIWTNETDVDYGEDTVQKDFSVAFTFTNPNPESGSVNGETFGTKTLKFFIVFPYLEHAGNLTWDGPAFVDFDNGSQLKISLSDAIFNVGAGGLNEGYAYKSTIVGTFELLKTPTGAVPEPATWAMMLGGFFGAGAMVRRRREVAAAA